MQCNANPRNKETKKKKKNAMVIKSRAMKHKDHVRKTHLD